MSIQDDLISNEELYEESGTNREALTSNFSDLNSKKYASHTQSFKSVLHCGMMSRNVIR